MMEQRQHNNLNFLRFNWLRDFRTDCRSTFNNKNVGTGKTVTVNSISLADGTNGGLAANYSISPGQTSTANVTAKALTVSGITASNKIYDGNTVATIDISTINYGGLVAGDDVVISTSGNFSDRNVASGKIVTITQVILVLI